MTAQERFECAKQFDELLQGRGRELLSDRLFIQKYPEIVRKITDLKTFFGFMTEFFEQDIELEAQGQL